MSNSRSDYLAAANLAANLTAISQRSEQIANLQTIASSLERQELIRKQRETKQNMLYDVHREITRIGTNIQNNPGREYGLLLVLDEVIRPLSLSHSDFDSVEWKQLCNETFAYRDSLLSWAQSNLSREDKNLAETMLEEYHQHERRKLDLQIKESERFWENHQREKRCKKAQWLAIMGLVFCFPPASLPICLLSLNIYRKEKMLDRAILAYVGIIINLGMLVLLTVLFISNSSSGR